MKAFECGKCGAEMNTAEAVEHPVECVTESSQPVINGKNVTSPQSNELEEERCFLVMIRKRDAEIAALTTRLDEAEALKAEAVREAYADALRTLHAEFSGMLDDIAFIQFKRCVAHFENKSKEPK